MSSPFLPAAAFPHEEAKPLDSLLRVDLAGEESAVTLYKGQIKNTQDPATQELLKEMLDEEARHVEILKKWVIQKNTRPSFLTGFWRFFGYTWGAIAAKLGTPYAMAQTEAVETVIERHYQEQIDFLQEKMPTQKKLIRCLEQLRDDEAAHKEEGAEHHHQSLGIDGWRFLTLEGTRLAIAIAKRI
ncbi:MAG: demethoxyubiquinone hydroxylase family protein [Holosporaceae bacterium]